MPIIRDTRPHQLAPVDKITCLYLIASGALASAWNSGLDKAELLIPLFFGGAILTALVPPMLRRIDRPWSVFLSAWYPVLCWTFFYKSTALLNKASPIPSLDPWLAKMDERFFSTPFCDLFSEALPQPGFAEAMAFFYSSYYIMIPGVGLWLWIRNRTLFFDFIFTTGFSFYLYYLLFSILPSAGPQYFLAGGEIRWEGWFFGPLLTDLLMAVECPTGAFPSSHVGIALVVTVFAWRSMRFAGTVLAFLSSGLAAAILYGGPHYFLDLPCGIATGVVFLFLSRITFCRRKLPGHRGQTPVQ